MEEPLNDSDAQLSSAPIVTLAFVIPANKVNCEARESALGWTEIHFFGSFQIIDPAFAGMTDILDRQSLNSPPHIYIHRLYPSNDDSFYKLKR